MANQLTQAVSPPGLSRAAAAALAERFVEPGWMRDFRLAAWETFESLPWPTTQDEAWRRTDLSGLRVEAFSVFADAPPGPPPPGLQELIEASGPGAGLLVQRNSVTVQADLAAGPAAGGVIFTDLHAALRDHPDLVRAHFMRLVRPEAGKFQALHGALWSGGTFVYVPGGVEVTLPLRAHTWIDAPGAAIFPHTLLIAGPGSKVTVIDSFGSADGATALALPIVELIVQDGAQVRFVTQQRWGRHIWEVGTIRSHLGRDATLHSLVVALGGAVMKTNVDSTLAGPGASSEMLGLVFGDGTQHFDLQTLQEHAAPHTTSDLLYKTAVKDRAASVFIGMIRVHPGAQKTNAFQSNRNLILAEGARAISDPKLEIMANDLRCTHGSATSRLNEEHIFYLMSRGLTRGEAVRMIVEGFFAELFDRVPLDALNARLHQAIAAKMLQ